ncbi:CARDB domain-containing protein [Natrinema salaciae]|uniref:Predicted metalloprotease, contains C-terminal PDZ domain n=1 Tax=Natrinema salaciae TaxID=1186196 RepID=A0A1H9IKP1_9EURY|nr:CARDB domain-containing protein [Natrinema salaciae]SEQ74955.1 Predicted metalloprotease, contains C-terminal PDZ domain [Natrinema salaciae]
MKSRFAALLVVVLLVASLPAGVAALEPARAAGSATTGGLDSRAGGTAPSIGTTAGSTVGSGGSEDVLHRTTVLRHRPADPDAFEVETTVHVPDPVTELEIELDPDATVESTAGFERTGDRTFEWTGGTDAPTVRYAMPADRRGDGEQGAGSAGGYTFVDTGDWGVVAVPDVSLSLRRTEPVGIERSVTVDGPGATGGDIAFFGAVREYERAVDGGTIKLVVPDAASLEESPDAILAALADARGRLAVGARTDEVFVVAVPSDVDWGQKRGIQYGRSDAWVVDDATLDEPNPVWLHEYVHVRQRFSNADGDTAPETSWLVEGQADYYAGLLALESGATDFADFSRLLERGEESPDADAVLADRSTWENRETMYTKGALVAGEIDRQLRLATDGDRTLEDVFRALNAGEGTVTEDDFLEAIEEAGGPTVRAVAERYTRTDESPEMWSRSQHEAAFEQPVADFAYGIGAEPLEVAGREWPRWNATEIDGTRVHDVIAVPAGESVSIPVAVENVGEREGTYDATLDVDGRVVAHRRGRLAPDEGTTHRLSWTPSEPGEYTVRVGAERLTAVVRSPASATVADLQVAPDSVDPGEPVTATATIAADDDRPAAAVVAFRTVDGIAAERSVALRPGETTTVEAPLRFDERGRYEIGVGDRTATVSVGADPAAALEEVPGFGLSAAAIAVAIALSILVARRR